MFTNFEYITFFSCPTERNIFYKRSILIKQLQLEIIEKKGCSKSVYVISIIYIIVLDWTDFVHPFFSIISSQSGFIEMNLYKKYFFRWGRRKMLYIQNWWTIPLNSLITIIYLYFLFCILALGWPHVSCITKTKTSLVIVYLPFRSSLNTF